MCAAPQKTVCGNVRGTAENCKAQVSPKSTTVRIDFVRQRTAGQFAAPSTTNAVCGNVRGTAENCKARQVNSLHTIHHQCCSVVELSREAALYQQSCKSSGRQILTPRIGLSADLSKNNFFLLKDVGLQLF